MKYKWEIREHYTCAELLAGLAEEAAELAQAALKWRRVLTGANPTPIDGDKAYEKLCEETADVLLYLEMIMNINSKRILDIKAEKEARWLERLKACQQ